MTEEGSLQGEAPLLTSPGSSCADPSSGLIGRSRNARLSTGYGPPSPARGARGEGGRARRRFQFCIERIQDVGRLFLQLSEPQLRQLQNRRNPSPPCWGTQHRAAFGNRGLNWGNLVQRFPGSTRIGPNLDLFRQVSRKLLKLLRHEMYDFVVSCDFKELRPFYFAAFFAVRLPIRPSGLV
jgi:hypothetical protein